MEDNINPLTLDVVVLEILGYVSPSMEDLLTFRQVCRLWRALATPLISSRSLELPMITFKAEGPKVEEMVEDYSLITLKTEGNAEDSDCVSCNAELSLLPKYIDYLESDVHPKIVFSVFHSNAISLDHPIVQGFLQKYGQTVKKLHLNQIDRDYYSGEPPLHKCAQEGRVDTQTFRQLLLSCPNLEELVLGYVDPEGGEDGFLLPDADFKTKIKKVAWVQFMEYETLKSQEKFISDLFQVCPSLERFLNVEDLDGRFATALSQSPHLSSLKELTIARGEEQAFQTLLKDELIEKLRLKKLKFKQMGLLNGPEVFQRFLDTQKSSLETLIVDDWGVDSHFSIDMMAPLPPIPFPDVMEKLQVWKIKDIIAEEDEDEEPDPIFRQLLLQPLDFHRQFPVLKTLILAGEARRYDLDALFVPGIEPQLVLDGLELPWGIEYQELGYIGDIFPNVKHLTLRGVEEDELRVLWTQWPQLESLFLDLEDVNIETSLTGLLSQQIPLVQSLIDNGNEITIRDDSPSIVNFKNLKELRILEGDKNEIVYDLPGAFLSDVSIHYSLSKLPKLGFLGVNLHKFTEEGINHLCSTRGLKWNKNDNATDWPLQCQKDLEMEYKERPNCNEDFADYKMAWFGNFDNADSDSDSDIL